MEHDCHREKWAREKWAMKHARATADTVYYLTDAECQKRNKCSVSSTFQMRRSHKIARRTKISRIEMFTSYQAKLKLGVQRRNWNDVRGVSKGAEAAKCTRILPENNFAWCRNFTNLIWPTINGVKQILREFAKIFNPISYSSWYLVRVG